MPQNFLLHRPQDHCSDVFSVSKSPAHVDDHLLIERIAAAYRPASTTYLGADDAIWRSAFGALKGDIHAALDANDISAAAEKLRNPAENFLFLGFESPFSGQTTPESWLRGHSQLVYNELLRLCEAAGVVNIENPEGYGSSKKPEILSPDALLEKLEANFDFRIEFPNPYPGVFGLSSSRGIATLRSVDALYQAWRLWTLIKKNPSARVLEIGGGLGRVAYFAYNFGLRDYTIVDLPMTGVAQSYFLGRTLGGEKIELYGEGCGGTRIKIKPPVHFVDGNDSYDMVLNADSLVEIDSEMSHRYAQAIARHSKRFLSINREDMPHTVRSLFSVGPVYRFPYWIRRGYVEELFEFIG